MATIKYTEDENGNKKIVIKNGKVSCECCIEMEIIYSWANTDKKDLDTSTRGFGENLGWSCANQGIYMDWITNDNTGLNGEEQVNAKVDKARSDGLWTSSYNIQCYAGWYIPARGSGPAELIVKYKKKEKRKQISPGEQRGCASTFVATVTVYSNKLPDDSFFEII
jgi:hypothetical protein